jgi:hypothetical protein
MLREVRYKAVLKLYCQKPAYIEHQFTSAFGLVRHELSCQLNVEDWTLLFNLSISSQFRWLGGRSHTATRLGTAGQDYERVEYSKRTSPLSAKLGNPATVLLLQILHRHPNERVSSE